MAKNNALKDACTQLPVPLNANVPGTLVKLCTPSTWEVLRELGNRGLRVRHQVQWLLNTNHCIIVGTNPGHVQLPSGGAAAPQGAADADPNGDDADDTSSDSSESND